MNGGGRCLALDIRVDPLPCRTVEHPSIAAEFGPEGKGGAYKVMTWADDQEEVLARLFAPQRHLEHGQRGRLQWSTELYRPGRQPGMACGEARVLAVHIFSHRGASGRDGLTGARL